MNTYEVAREIISGGGALRISEEAKREAVALEEAQRKEREAERFFEAFERLAARAPVHAPQVRSNGEVVTTVTAFSTEEILVEAAAIDAERLFEDILGGVLAALAEQDEEDEEDVEALESLRAALNYEPAEVLHVV